MKFLTPLKYSICTHSTNYSNHVFSSYFRAYNSCSATTQTI